MKKKPLQVFIKEKHWKWNWRAEHELAANENPVFQLRLEISKTWASFYLCLGWKIYLQSSKLSFLTKIYNLGKLKVRSVSDFSVESDFILRSTLLSVAKIFTELFTLFDEIHFLILIFSFKAICCKKSQPKRMLFNDL